MPVTPEDVRHIARLARLHVRAEDEPHVAADLSRILDYMDQLASVDTRAVEPLTHLLDEEAPAPLRPDVVAPRFTRQDALAEAPDTTDAFVRVPRVISGSP